MASKKTALAKIIGASVAASLTMASAVADTNTSPFGATDLSAGFNLAAVGDKGKEGKCGEGKCGEGKKKEGKCGEGKCGEGKKKEGKCGEGKCGEGKKKEGKCGEGKCGGAA